MIGIAFLNSFMSYLLVFVIFVVAIVAAVCIGVFLRKMKNKKASQKVVKVEENI